MKFIGIIPARYASTRFPGKPLTMIKGKTMINHVYDQASICKVFSRVIVATDDDRIAENVQGFGGEVMMTSDQHRSGTERCNEVSGKLIENGEIEISDVIINIQGDEPFIQQQQINLLADCFLDEDVKIATLAKKVKNNDELFDKNVVKVIIDQLGNAIYFSRSPLPFVRGKNSGEWLSVQTYYKHIGIYAYRGNVLQNICKLKSSPLEVSESLEQLRWIANAFKIKVKITEIEAIGIDTPEDLLKLK
ncbi:MAG: 3-deoxy-manno-octulosonate cytidylyltransferase [Bacteroidales bacterium]|nr:3-deoxy-manno-octulosonate cytidylyltransferase [Bacteroidales bacterium]